MHLNATYKDFLLRGLLASGLTYLGFQPFGAILKSEWFRMSLNITPVKSLKNYETLVQTVLKSAGTKPASNSFNFTQHLVSAGMQDDFATFTAQSSAMWRATRYSPRAVARDTPQARLQSLRRTRAPKNRAMLGLSWLQDECVMLLFNVSTFKINFKLLCNLEQVSTELVLLCSFIGALVTSCWCADTTRTQIAGWRQFQCLAPWCPTLACLATHYADKMDTWNCLIDCLVM